MNNAQLYLAWLRTYAPTVYSTAVRKATGQERTLGGLADDLVNKAFAPDLMHSFLGDDTNLDISADTFDPTLPAGFDASSIATSPVPVDTGYVSTPAPTPSSGGSTVGSIFSGIISAVGSIGAGVINASNQSKLIALNTTRAQQGLPPVDANGRVVNASSLATTSNALLNFERSITGGSMMPLILGVLGVGVVIMLMNRKAA